MAGVSGLALRGGFARPIVVLAALVVGCVTDSAGPGGPPVVSVDVTPATAPVPVTTTLQLTAVPKDSSGAPLSGRSVTWATSAPSIAAVSGSGMVTGLSLGPATITATSEGHSGTAAITVTPGPAARLVFTAQPNSATAGATISPPLQVTARDVQGNTATGFTGNVTVALGSNPGGATLSGTTSLAAVAGVATFTDLSLNRSGPGYTLVATSGSLTAATSAAITVSAAAATQLAFTVQPGGTTATAGEPITPPVQVTVQDAFGNTATGFGGAVTVAIGTNPSSGVLTGTLTRAATAGVASFADLRIDKSGTGYTLTASAAGTITDTSTAFNITAGSASASQSTVTASPTTIAASAGSSAATITITAKDAYGNSIQGAMVVLAATGTGNTLTQPGGTTDVSGVATGTLSSTDVGAKVVSATINSVAITQTATVTVTVGGVSASQSTVSALPTTITASSGSSASTITVTAKDDFGNPIQGATVVLAATGTGNTLTPPGATNATGVTTGTLSSTDVGAKVVSATINGVATTQTATVTVGAAGVSATQSTVSASPTTITASTGSSASTITVTARDAFGNPIQGATVVLAATGTGNTLNQPGGTTNASGVVTGTLSSIDAGAKVASATINSLAITQTSTVTVNAAGVSASQSTVIASPTTITATNGAITSTLTVTARDAFGNPIQGASVILASTGTGNAFAPAGPLTTNASGVATATFSSTVAEAKAVSARINGTLVTQTATVTVVPGEVSGSQSSMTASPSTITASTGASLSTITVTARDDQGNPIPGMTVVLSATGSGNTLTQPAGMTNSSGVATGTLYSTVAEAKVASATIDGTGDQSDTVIVNPAGANRLAFFVQPTSTTVGSTITPAVRVEIRDQFGNRVTSATNNVTLAIGVNPGGGTLSGTATVAAVAGVATFSNLSINQVGTGYTLTASATSLSGATSSAFNITSGVVSSSQSTVAAIPTSITAGSGTSTITVTARDAGGNPVSGATVVLSASGTGNTVTQPAGPTDANGVATGSLSSTVAGAKTVTASVNSVTLSQSPIVTVTAGAISASQSTVSASPASIVAGGATSTITVTVKDAFGNPVSGATVSLAATGTGNTLTQPSVPSNGSGVATGALSSTVAEPKVVSATAGGTPITQAATVTVTTPGSSVVFVGAGDIANCSSLDDEATAALINALPTAEVYTLGDNVYPNGTLSEFNNCYHPSWGAFKARTHPATGNHEYYTSGAAGYFGYFGAAAGTAGQGYYSYDLGAWHIIVLNSSISMAANSAQMQWLRGDLATHPNLCTLAYWHHPLYSSIGGSSGSTGATTSSVRPMWDTLYAYGADVVLAGHRHVYERLARMAPNGSPDPVTGIREFIVGSGGESGGDLTNIFPTSEVREGRTFGVLKLTLYATSYDWEFIPVAGKTFTDRSIQPEACH